MPPPPPPPEQPQHGVGIRELHMKTAWLCHAFLTEIIIQESGCLMDGRLKVLKRRGLQSYGWLALPQPQTLTTDYFQWGVRQRKNSEDASNQADGAET